MSAYNDWQDWREDLAQRLFATLRPGINWDAAGEEEQARAYSAADLVLQFQRVEPFEYRWAYECGGRPRPLEWAGRYVYDRREGRMVEQENPWLPVPGQDGPWFPFAVNSHSVPCWRRLYRRRKN